MIRVGSRVVLKPTVDAPHVLRAAIAHMGDVEGEVRIMSSLGDCVVQLPTGVTIPGCSKAYRPDQHALWIHKSHLQPLAD